MPTPYDGKVALWHVYGGMIAERSIAEMCSTIKRLAPAVNALFVKITDGTDWMGRYEPKSDLAINGAQDIDRWVSILNQYGIEFHAWALPKGVDPQQEADLMVTACSRPGVRSLILDVEGGPGFFRGGRGAIRPLMLALKRGLGTTFHIGMSVDPRPDHYDEIFPDEWRPYIASLHPQAYWGAFGQTPDQTLRNTYTTWESYGVPIIPALQAYQVTTSTMDRARSQALFTYKAAGISWYVFGQIATEQFKAVNVTIAGTSPDDDTTPPAPISPGNYGREIVVKPSDSAYVDGSYDGTPSPLKPFQNEAGWLSKYVSTSSTISNVWARWDPQIRTGGFWEISAYVPSQHGTTNNARYKVHGIIGQGGEYEAAIRQDPMDNLWVPFGIFSLAPNDPTAGVVFLNDLTRETDREITFDAIRWREVVGMTQPPSYLADGFDSPVGSIAERRAATIYPGQWFPTIKFGQSYLVGGDASRPALHTGDDLFSKQGELATAHQPVFATGSGVVVNASKLTGTWGNVIVIRHDPHILTGQIVYSRYGHVESMQVKPGDRVVRGQYIANIGNAFGAFIYHLHFDISYSRILQTRPSDWPAMDKKRLNDNYLNPNDFVSKRRPASP